MHRLALLCLLCTISYLHAYVVAPRELVKRATDQEIIDRINAEGNLTFSRVIRASAKERRKIACFFVFDKDASADLNNNPDLGKRYADKLADLASRYMAHANIVVTNAGSEMWTNSDQISFARGDSAGSSMPDFLSRFQAYLDKTQKSTFGTTYAVGVLIASKTLVGGGYSQGPPCTTSGASVINYRPSPWQIGGLIAHELAHTLAVVHPFDIFYVCQAFPTLSFCASTNPPDECMCTSSAFPAEQCLMTFAFGRAPSNAAQFTSCDIEMMNQFSSNIACLIK